MDGSHADQQPRRARPALRKGPVVLIALRLGPGEWEPLYAIYGRKRVALPRRFCWTIEAICALEMAFEEA